MPNRILKESICTSETIHRLTAPERDFFFRLIVHCDDYGRMDARPRILRARCFPLELEIIKDTHISQWLGRFMEVELIEVYECRGQPYLHMLSWDRHQQIRAKHPKYPAPSQGKPLTDDIGTQLLSDASTCPRNPIQSNPIQSTSELSRANPPATQFEESIGHGMSDVADRAGGNGLYSPETEAFRLATILRQRLLDRNPKAKVPQVASGPFQAWCYHVDGLLKRGHEPDEVEAVIEWSQQDAFWHRNILSTRSLNEKYDRLFLGWREAQRSAQKEPVPIWNGRQQRKTVSEAPESEEYDPIKHRN